MAIPPGVDASYIKYFALTWVALASVVDSNDPNDEPDKDTLSGTVLLKPTLTQPLLFKNIDVPFTLPIMRRTIDLVNGQFDEQGRAYIKLEASVPEGDPVDWYWTASFSVAYRGVPISINPVVFMAPPNATIDLTEMMIASQNTTHPSVTDPTQNIYTLNFGGVRGHQRLTFDEYNALPQPNDEVAYYLYTP